MPGASTQTLKQLSPSERRRSISNAYANAGLWGLGNGLTGTTLFFYLAKAYGATGFTLSMLLAVPAAVGVLRLFTSLWMDRVGSRKRFCVAMFLASSVVLLGLPLMSAPGVFFSATRSLTALLICWTGYNVLEHFAVVAMWSWFLDLVPRQLRGRFVGRRAASMNAGRICGALISAIGTLWWREYCESTRSVEQLWLGYAAFAAAGALLMACAVWPLVCMCDVPSPCEVGCRSARLRLRELLRPFADRDFRKLLAYGSWFSMSNGITATAVRVFQISVLDLTFAEKRTLDAGSRGVQTLLMPAAGKLADRHTNIPLLIVSQCLVASSLLFLLPATAEARSWIVVVYIMWIAYAGINVALPNLVLGLSEPECSASYTAAWFATTQLAYAISTLCGGALYDWLQGSWQPINCGTWTIDHYAVLFLLGFTLRISGVVWAARIPEPKQTSGFSQSR